MKMKQPSSDFGMLESIIRSVQKLNTDLGLYWLQVQSLVKRIEALEVAVDMPELSTMPSADEGISALPRWRKGNYR